MTVVIRQRDYPTTDPRLGRRVHHDSRSRSFAYDTSGLSIVSAKHTRRIGVMDQGSIGACTAFAGIGCLGTDPYYDTLRSADAGRSADVVRGLYPLTAAGALDLYRAVTRADPFPGAWEPDDTGSDGTSIGKVLKAAGEISGYRWTFTLDDALKALGVTPFITGTEWTTQMFYPDADGRVRITGAVEGGHEYVADEIDAENERVWFTNSWGPHWGVVRDGRPGRFYQTFADFGTLLARQGDVVIFTPLTEPAPTPTPDPDVDPADVEFASALRPWCDQPHIAFGNPQAARAARTWLGKRVL